MKITIIYDNEVWQSGLRSDWGFSCLVEINGRTILFDTGASGGILLGNMGELGIDPHTIDEVFISHAHFDHTGGLTDFLNVHPCRVFIPFSCSAPAGLGEIIKVKTHLEIYEGVFSTGELSGIEQSLVMDIGSGFVVLAGCSHPGVKNILDAASAHGSVKALIGGLHGFNEFDLIEGLEMICPTHCTQYKREIKSLYPGTYVEGGAGRIIEI